jgi:hypothetical protein
MNEAHDDKPIARGASLDWAWDWTDWLQAGDTIASQTIEGSAEIMAGAPTAAGAIVTAVLTCAADAPVASRQRATCTVTTVAGLTDSRTIRLVVAAR